MSVQLTYAQQPEFALGTINGVAPHTIVSMIAEEAITFGQATKRGTDASSQVLIDDAADTAHAVFGIAISQASLEAGYPSTATTSQANSTWPIGVAVGCVRDGVITGEIGNGTTAVAGDPVYLNAGAFSSTGSNALTNVVFESDSVICVDALGTSRVLANVRIWPSS